MLAAMTSLPPLATHRLFIGLLPDEPVARAILAWRARGSWPAGAAMAAPAHVHLTMAFLGEVDPAVVGPLQAALSAVPFDPFMLELGAFQVWPPGIAVLRPRPNEALDRLHARLAGVLASLGMASVTRRWKPHVTLARKAQGARPPAQEAAIAWPVGGFALVWSRLPPQVPVARYQMLRWWGGTPAPAVLEWTRPAVPSSAQP